MISTFKNLVPVVAVLTLVACGSTPKTTSHKNTTNNPSPANTYIESGADTKLFAQLIKVKDGYEFTHFTTLKPNARSSKPWVQLDTGTPHWDVSDRERCAMDNLGINKSQCDIDEKLFFNTHRNVSGTVIGAIVSFGIATVVDVKFDKDLYVASYQNALNKLVYNGKSGVEALRALPNIAALLNEFDNSKSKIIPYQEAARLNDLELTSISNLPNVKVNSFSSFSSLLENIHTLTVYSNTVANNLDTIHQKLNESLVAKIKLMPEGELFDWIYEHELEQYVSQATLDMAAKRSNKLALQSISELKSYQEAERKIQFLSDLSYIDPATVSAANKQFLKLLNKSS